ncbi:uncharacterized protein LOC113464135 isoform X2 [Ceratina calcarata]|uniref:Uncharacterized protein LOC113464135 isoform X2 n=1 Tax=Ceratina calcarata TaxID=156304 RepID=A0AAJ7RZA9_9HYME|nr:uncharacterized protein LOC113464135 isoform X2 [Ceratina calcarata]
MVEIKYIIYFVCAAGWKRSSQSSPRSLEEVRKRKCEISTKCQTSLGQPEFEPSRTSSCLICVQVSMCPGLNYIRS